MPNAITKSRQALRSRFVNNAIPSEADFADLIGASLNQADDGLLKLPDQPLALVRQKPDQPVLRFFADPAAERAAWQVQLGPGDTPSFGLATADGKPALFVDGATGNVGIGTAAPSAKLQITGHASITSNEGSNFACANNFMAPGSLTIGGIDRNFGGGKSWNENTAGLLLETLDNTEIAVHDAHTRLASLIYYESTNNRITIGRDMGWGGISAVCIEGGLNVTGNMGVNNNTPAFKLDINGTARLGGFTTEAKDEWPNVVWCRQPDAGWDEGLIKHAPDKGFFRRSGFGVHMHESRSFSVYSTGWRPLLGIEGGTGNTSIRGQTEILTGTNAIRFSSSWTGLPDNRTNAAEISNDTSVYKTLMIVGNKSNGGGRRVSIWDTLEVNGTFQINNNGNNFRIDTLGDRLIFTLSRAYHGAGRSISWDGDNNWDQWSDETLKTDIQHVTGILPRLMQIDVKSFQWKSEPTPSKRQLGFIAQEVRLAFPELVKEKALGNERLMSLNYTNFGILAVGAIKELNDSLSMQIQELRTELQRLKQQVDN